MNKMVCSVELVLWVIAAMVGIALGLGFSTSGLVVMLANSDDYLYPLSHQFFYAALAFILFRFAMLRIDRGWHRTLFYYGLGAVLLIIIRMSVV